ncbi:Ig-like domain-containing protein [Clostridium lacusfryxellense]|uniref:Ig-like domain-containing protein n=1 Tax=Clostridium lacusfryxellense TaxID=205328 RepID=UPI001C0DC0BC|nr:Ig-like domain-containing protein [Clostridium lacusfryxellense]MBU3111000.1 Ig-like domain-containing protein [Clostridium lacusfryxellense]
MKKTQFSYFLCFTFTFLLLFINIEVFAGTIIRVNKVSINKTTDILIVGQADTIRATMTPSNATNRAVKWTSSNAAIAKIDIWGKVTSLKAGTVTITGVTVDKRLKVSCRITIKPKPVIRVNKVSINKTTDILIVGQAYTIRATMTPANATNRAVKWTSSNTAIAKIDIWGKVTSLKAGTVTITGITSDKGLKISCRITVKPILSAPNYKLLFNLNDTLNFQSITFFNQYLYCGFDIGNGKGKISKYSMSGKKISETKSMAVGHSADLAYRAKTGNIYIANGGGNSKTHVYVVKYESSQILSNLNFEKLGTSALIAIDNVHDYLILHTVLSSGDSGSPKFTIINLANMKVINTFNVPNQGVPQGLEVHGNQIYLYTNNKITTFDYNGKKISTRYISNTGESEGIAMTLDNNFQRLVIGYTGENRIYRFN